MGTRLPHSSQSGFFFLSLFCSLSFFFSFLFSFSFFFPFSFSFFFLFSSFSFSLSCSFSVSFSFSISFSFLVHTFAAFRGTSLRSWFQEKVFRNAASRLIGALCFARGFKKKCFATPLRGLSGHFASLVFF